VAAGQMAQSQPADPASAPSPPNPESGHGVLRYRQVFWLVDHSSPRPSFPAAFQGDQWTPHRHRCGL